LYEKKENIVKRTLISLLIACAIAHQEPLAAQQLYSITQLTDSNGQTITGWIEHNQSLIIRLEPSNTTKVEANGIVINHNQFQIMLGDSDISSLFNFKQNSLVFTGGIPLPAGEQTLLVNQFVNNQWIEVGTVQLSVMTSAGFKQAEWTKTLEININSQLDEKASGDSVVSDRPRYSDVTTSIGLASHHQNETLTIDSHVNLLSVSNRQQAVQFGNKQNKANKLDVTDYSASIASGNHQVIIGHTSFGSNSLLIDGLSRRGISWQYKNENELTFNGAILSGSDIVGYNNFFGLADYSKQYVNALGFGLNTFTDSRISLRIEGTYLDAERLSQSDFGIGEVASSETNKGLGFHFIASDKDGRLSSDLTIGFSRYNNPDDLNLSLGDDLVALDIETAVAHNLNLSYKLVQEWESPWGTNTNITINANHSKAEPLYQTLTAFVQANVKNKLLAAQYQFGNVSGNFGVQSSRDNLDNLVNLLTTKTNNTSFSSSLPTAQIFLSEGSEGEPSVWLPQLDYSFQETHQYALTSPNTDESGFNDDSHLPDQLTTAHNLSASWQLQSYSLSLQTSHNNQDNRQIGREESDFISLQHTASINWQQNDTTAWSFSLGKNRQADLENNKIQYSKSFTVSYNWQSVEGLGLAINYGLSKDDDSLNEASNTSTTADIGLVKNLVNGEWWFPANGSVSLRLNYNDSKSIDNVFDQANRFGTKTAQLGINLSF